MAVWRQIESTLSEEIRRKIWGPGERLPNESELAERFGVNRHTVRRAMSVLEKEGLIRVEQGRGTFVQDYAIDYAIGKRTRFSENLHQLGFTASLEVLRHTELAAGVEAARALKLARGTPLAHVLTRGVAQGKPINVSESYFPANRFAGIGASIAEHGSITAALRGFGVADYTRASTRVTARMPDAETARILGQPKGRPVLHVEALNLDAEGEPIQYSVTRFAGDWVQLVME